MVKVKKLKSLARQIRNFGTTYGLEIFFTNPLFPNAKLFGFYSFDLMGMKGYGFVLFIIGLNVKRKFYLDLEDL